MTVCCLYPFVELIIILVGLIWKCLACIGYRHRVCDRVILIWLLLLVHWESIANQWRRCSCCSHSRRSSASTSTRSREHVVLANVYCLAGVWEGKLCWSVRFLCLDSVIYATVYAAASTVAAVTTVGSVTADCFITTAVTYNSNAA